MSDALLSHYSVAPKSLLRQGVAAPVDLHIYMPANRHILLFLKQGDPLSDRDISTIDQLKDGSLIIKKTDYPAFMKALCEASVGAVVNDPTSPAAQSIAQSILRGLSMSELNGVDLTLDDLRERSAEMLETSFSFVHELLQECKRTPTVQSFLDVLKRSETTSSPLQTHCRHVSALATLSLLCLGNASMEDLSDIAFAGLVHDIGLGELPKVLIEKHLAGVAPEQLNVSEKIVLMRHIDEVYEQLKMGKTFVSEGARRIVDQHHENCAGTGFKGLTKNRIYRSARVMRIAEEFVLNVQHPERPSSAPMAFEILHQMADLETGQKTLDPEILAQLQKAILC